MSKIFGSVHTDGIQLKVRNGHSHYWVVMQDNFGDDVGISLHVAGVKKDRLENAVRAFNDAMEVSPDLEPHAVAPVYTGHLVVGEP
jgi:hypothetical protein